MVRLTATYTGTGTGTGYKNEHIDIVISMVGHSDIEIPSSFGSLKFRCLDDCP